MLVVCLGFIMTSEQDARRFAPRCPTFDVTITDSPMEGLLKQVQPQYQILRTKGSGRIHPGQWYGIPMSVGQTIWRS